jgi:hypothetical protein
VDDLHQMQ